MKNPPAIYGIKNCDTVRKTLEWMKKKNIPYVFHEYKKDGVDEKVLKAAIQEKGWESIINRKGTTWRALPDETKNRMNEKLAIETAQNNPSLIKRPLTVSGANILVGFDEEEYTAAFTGYGALPKKTRSQ